ncbi:hypothetical protein [Achromobacter sp. ES-001]|nr:hypothetical protein [Achromobacter sp. ES-001]
MTTTLLSRLRSHAAHLSVAAVALAVGLLAGKIWMLWQALS